MCLLPLNHGGITVQDNDGTRRFCHFLENRKSKHKKNIVVTFCWKPLHGVCMTSTINGQFSDQFLPVLDFSAFDCISFQFSDNFTHKM